MNTTTDVVIIGGGVIGCAIAYYLRKSQISVTLLERGEIGSQASSAAAGLLAPLGPLSGPGPFADLLLASFSLFPSLVSELEAMSGFQLGFEQTGALRVVRHPRRIAHLRKRMESWQPLGLTLHWLTGTEAHQQEPQLAPDICAAIYAPQESQIQAPQVVRAYAQSAKQLGASIHTYIEVIGLETSQAKVTGVHTSLGETIACRHLIIATGAWSAYCGAWLNTALPIRPERGQILSLQQPSPFLRHIIFGEAAYLVPRAQSVIVGATKEDVGFDLQVTDAGRTWLYDVATRLVPSLDQVESTWAGLRPRTPDSQPILGPLPGWENVTIAAGHNSTGILLSAITGQSIAEFVTTGRTPPIIRPFSLARFSSQ